uniref:thiol oxidase n=1 Tax=viral metagenome TaxID=1070528 RepID=A0A6C0KRF4_9ZZZZ
MDTRFWGPSGWKLLHLVAYEYEPTVKDKKAYAQFFETVPFILPCKFCRASLTDYYREHPYQNKGQILPDFNLTKWIYDIHNCVNDKLRKQGLYPSPNPTFRKVDAFYKSWRTCDWYQQLSTFWDFLFAVAYNHPKETRHHSKPMPNCPPDIHECKDTCEKNKWNVLGFKERMHWFTQFWHLLPAVLPLDIQKHWKRVQHMNPLTLDSRRSVLAWLWRMRCGLDTDFKDPYTSVCQRIASYSSDCGKKKRAITCRKRRFTSVPRFGKTVKNKKSVRK